MDDGDSECGHALASVFKTRGLLIDAGSEGDIARIGEPATAGRYQDRVRHFPEG